TAAGPAAAPTADGGGRTVIFVTNEVGMGIVPAHPGGRLFRDLAGRCNQVFAREADAVVFMVSGIPLWIKGKDSFPSRP
ncbi:MAG TPA: bifunctional adenosylcobinamide kinase/adenosylcobinamide-phosphate guanylyltransferase, partial [Syntrophales bacterium]|nr:bifunctional adenosylcobinamide kinase/adenosylcobinamide-phosphate guanylyltransferase [Syntrophales bacterium]